MKTNKTTTYKLILDYFRKQGEFDTELEYGSVFQLLIAVVLSAQCTDKRVNMIKAKHIVELSKMIMSDYGGEVPSDMDSLQKLPGVGRKTANVMLAVAFGRDAMPVDTHVYRVSHRLGLVGKSCNTPLKVEKELCKHISKGELGKAHHWLLLHGRYVCKSLKPLCNKCPFVSFCPKKLEDSKL